LGEEYRSLRSSLCSFLHSPVYIRVHVIFRNITMNCCKYQIHKC
jgi:hypothetical protein